MKTFLILLFAVSTTFAHHGPAKGLHHDKDGRIHVLSKRISEKPTARLLTLRAKVYLDAGLKAKAIHDLEQAIMLDKNYQEALDLLKKHRDSVK